MLKCSSERGGKVIAMARKLRSVGGGDPVSSSKIHCNDSWVSVELDSRGQRRDCGADFDTLRFIARDGSR